MKPHQLKLGLVLFFGINLSVIQAQNMFVRETNGTQTPYSLTNIKKLTFSSGNLMVYNTSEITDIYALNEMRYLNFKDLTLDINQPKAVFQQIMAYPNPVNDVLNISISEYSQPIINIEIISIEGRVMLQKNLSIKNQLYQVNVSELPLGLYFCRISHKETSQTIKFIKH